MNSTRKVGNVNEQDDQSEWLRQRFARVLSAALKSSGLPLARVQSRLNALGTPVSIATLSYWQSGRSLPQRKKSLHAVENLEAIVGLQPGSLTRLIPARSDQYPRLTLGIWDSPFTARALDAFDLNHALAITVLAMEVRHHVGPGRTTSSTWVRRRFRVDAGPIKRMPLILSLGLPPAPNLASHAGFTLGQEYRDNQNGTAVLEMVMPRTLQTGDVHELESMAEWGPGEPLQESFDWGLPSGADHFSLRLTFEPDEMPLRTIGFGAGSPETGTPQLFRRELRPVDGAFRLDVQNAVPGVYGIATC